MSKYSGLQLKTTIKDLDGQEMIIHLNDKSPAGKMTLKEIIAFALTATINDPNEATVTETQKFQDYDLARDIVRLKDEEEVEIESSAKARIQSLLLKIFGKRIAGFVRDIFEGKEELIKTPTHFNQ